MGDPERLAQRLAELLMRVGHQLVVVESCTAGLVMASLGGVPGISSALMGGWVVYQSGAKSGWLGVPSELVSSGGPGPVSGPVTEALAWGAIERAPGATLALAITGHLGPEAPAGLDGVVYTAVARPAAERPMLRRWQLRGPAPEGSRQEAAKRRRDRQHRAAARGLLHLLAILDGSS